MEDKKKSRARSRKSATNSVARQFSPSRIETLLLTRLFDLASQPCGEFSGLDMPPSELIVCDFRQTVSARHAGTSTRALRKGA